MLGAGQKIIVIVGPTASGKSDLGIKIAQKFNGEIISADSRQVYRGMDIGTGKVLRDKYKGHLCNTKMPFVSSGIEHHLIDVANPKKQFTANDFKKLGRKAITDITSRNKIPIIVGGTGFYIDVLLGRMLIAEVPPDKKLRARFDKLTAEHLFKMLRKLNPERARTIEPKNKRRLIRALEIILSTGRPVPKLVSSIKYQVLWLGIRPKDLNIKIKKRLDARLKQGMVKEVAKLQKQGLSWKRLDDFGLEHRWVSRWLKKTKSKIPDSKFLNSDEYNNLLRDIIKYSKRQMTWFKRNKEIHWINPPADGRKEAEGLAKKFLLA